MKYAFLMAILFLSKNINAQMKNDFYKSFSSSDRQEHTVNFENDSVIRFQNVQRHMSGVVRIYGKYKKINDTIYVEIPHLTDKDSIEVSSFGLTYLSGLKFKLSKHKTEFIDTANDVLYVTSDIYYSNYVRRKLVALINNKKYIVDVGLVDGYGLIKSEPHRNRKFSKAMKEVSENPDDYTCKKYGMIEGYEKFGILGINGIIDFHKKPVTAVPGN